MRKIMTGVLVAAVISIALVARAPAGDSQATLKQHVWWAEGWQPVAQQATVAKPNPAAAAAIARLDSNSLNPWYVEWNAGSGMPDRILGRSLKLYGGPPAEAAQRFLEENRSFFTGLSPENDHGEVQFEIKEVFTGDPKDVGVTFRELYKGIPVYEAGPAVHFDQEGHVTGAGGTLYYIAPLDVTPTLSPQAAIEALRRATAPDSLAQFGDTPLLVWPGGPTARLAYRINISVSPGARGVFSGSAYVDAHSGEVLGRESWMRLDPGPEYHRGGAINGRDSSSVGPSDKRRHPAFKNVQIKRVPEEEWRAAKRGKVVKPDSQVTPFDTTLPRPRRVA